MQPELRKNYAAFRSTRVLWLKNSDEADLVTFMRLDTNDEFVIIINFSNRPLNGSVDVMNSGDFQPVSILGMPRIAAADFPSLHLGAFEWRIYHRVLLH
jgi:hypothetical protein